MADKHLEIVKKIVLSGLTRWQADVYLFGSRAAGAAEP